ncbi:MAG: hypothetical protein V1740_07115 [Candidatus Woesearchaeota archaeon]
MKTSNSLIKDVLSEIVGSDTIPLVMYLKNKKNISEFKIAESIKQEVNITRNMLYRLYDVNLVTFIRKKDKVKGWYIYYWTFNPKRVKYLVQDIKVKKLDGLKERLKRENQSNFFICKNKCIRLDFDQVTEFEYKCPECGELMHEDDKPGKIKEIEIQIKKLEKEQNNQTQ